MTLVLIVALVTGAILFGIGVYGALSQTNLVMIMMGVELILAGALVNLVAFWRSVSEGPALRQVTPKATPARCSCWW